MDVKVRAASPSVSVLMPVFNTDAYLLEALMSISNQTFTNFELVVLDDGSSDKSLRIIQEYALLENRMTYVSRPNKGLIASRNELLSLAQGEFIAWMDSDDISLPDRLQKQIQYFRINPNVLCLGSAAQCIDPDGRNLNIEHYPSNHEDIVACQLNGGGMRFATTMIPTAILESLGGFREPLKMGEDFDFLIRLSEKGIVSNLPESLYLYRQHLKSVCASTGPAWTIYRDAVLKLARERATVGSDILQKGGSLNLTLPKNQSTRKLEAVALANWANSALDNKDKSLALKYAIASISRNPTSRGGWRVLKKLLIGTM